MTSGGARTDWQRRRCLLKSSRARSSSWNAVEVAELEELVVGEYHPRPEEIGAVLLDRGLEVTDKGISRHTGALGDSALSSQPMKRVRYAIVVVAVSLHGVAHAEPTPVSPEKPIDACRDAFEAAQVEHERGALVHARKR